VTRRVLALAVVALALAIAALAGESVPAPERFDTVVVDAGHGGDDHGAEGPSGLLEKQLALDLAKQVAERLRAQGLRVVMTRSDDRFVPLAERTRIANEAGGDLFLSIHANASSSRLARGIETFFASLQATDQAALELAKAENLAFGASAEATAAADPVAAILGDMLATEHLAESQEFARMAQRRLAADAESRGVKQAPFLVLMGARMPAALLEVGFITNRAEEARLKDKGEQARVAEEIARAVASYRTRADAKLGVAAAVEAQ
jgi:N-acetylmuramoyl-L-alanine amidase